MQEPLKVFIGYDSKEPIAYHVLSHSIMRRASRPVSITPLSLDNLKGVLYPGTRSDRSHRVQHLAFLGPISV
jgi:hypothetical protein